MQIARTSIRETGQSCTACSDETYEFSLILSLGTPQELKGRETSEALRKLTAAALSEKELKHQLGKVRFAAKEMEDSYNALHSEKEAALAKVRPSCSLQMSSCCWSQRLHSPQAVSLDCYRNKCGMCCTPPPP